MKKFRLLFLIIAAMLAGTQAGVAQNWTGHTPESLLNASGQASEIYLWNVGTKQFLYTGGSWGTQAITYDTGCPFTISRGGAWWGGGYWYSLQTHLTDASNPSGYLGLTDGTETTSVHDTGKWFLDAASRYGEFLQLHFTQVSGNIYNISVEISRNSTGGSYDGETVYLVASNKNGNITASTGNVTGNTNAQWILVTLEDVRANFSNNTAEAAGASPLDATYILYNQHFMRNNNDISKWHTGEVNSTNEATTSLTFEYTNIDFTKYKNHMLSPTDDIVPNYYVGNGYAKNDDQGTSTDNPLYEDNSDIELSNGDSHQKLYGAYWTANIKGNGTIWQKVRVPVEYTGWYIISCDGLTTKTEGTVNLFAATYSDNNLTNQITRVASPFTTVTGTADAPETYTEAGQLLFTNENYGKQVLIYIDSETSDPYLVLGVEATGVNNDSWTCVDNFQIRYAGNPESDIILDENREDIAYINAQVDNAKSYTLRLNRAFINNAWNSLILPVDLTAQQLHLTFGNNVKLSEKKTEASNNPYVIEFKSIDLSNKDDDEIVLHAGVPYIIKPSRLIPTTPAEGGDTYQIRNTQESITFVDPYYTINQVTLGKAVEATVTSTAYDCGNAGSMYFKGTYTKQTKENGNAPKKNSYLLSEGKWFHMTVDVNSVKGFRTWLEPAENTESNANMQFSVDGVIDGDVTNSIDGIENGFNSKADNKVYNMNGQLVRNGSTSLEGLPKGVYIVNNKKYIVK